MRTGCAAAGERSMHTAWRACQEQLRYAKRRLANGFGRREACRRRMFATVSTTADLYLHTLSGCTTVFRHGDHQGGRGQVVL